MTSVRTREPVGDGTESWHGTKVGYKTHACGCDSCRQWNADAARVERKLRKLANPPNPPKPPIYKPEPTGELCACGCAEPAIGDEYATTRCAKRVYGVVIHEERVTA